MSIEAVFNPLLPIDDIDYLVEMVRVGCRKHNELVVLRHFLEEVLAVGPEAVRLFGVTHNLQQIHDQSVPFGSWWRQIRVGSHS